MANLRTKIKWTVIYLLAAVVGLFAGANLLASNVGAFLYDLTHRTSHTQLVELDELTLVLYGGLVGVLLAVVVVTLIKVKLSRK
jgi:hypothetical protein